MKEWDLIFMGLGERCMHVFKRVEKQCCSGMTSSDNINIMYCYVVEYSGMSLVENERLVTRRPKILVTTVFFKG